MHFCDLKYEMNDNRLNCLTLNEMLLEMFIMLCEKSSYCSRFRHKTRFCLTFGQENELSVIIPVQKSYFSNVLMKNLFKTIKNKQNE